MTSIIWNRLGLYSTFRVNGRNVVPNLTRGVRFFTSQIKQWTKDELDKTVKENKVVVFMKGTPDAPMCGFSRAVVQILDMHGMNRVATFDVLSDDNLRKNIKEYSNWPTIPQVYINGDFVGGCDIMIQLHRNGELIDELEKVGHRSALLDEGQD